MICFDQCNVSGSDQPLLVGMFNCYVRYCDDYRRIGGYKASTSLCPWVADEQSPLLICFGH